MVQRDRHVAMIPSGFHESARICIMDKYRRSLPIAFALGLAACSGGTPAVPSAGDAAPPAADTGARIFNGNCVPCHQQNGQGIPGVYPSLAGSPVVLGDPAALALWVIKGQRPAS